VVNLTRQVLGNYSATVHARMMRAYAEKDLPAFRAAADRFLEIGRDLDILVGTRHEFLLGRWLADARRWAADPAEAPYYERNARQIITTWHKPGGELSDYAHRQWNGLLRTYYLPRWQEFIARLDRSLAGDQPLDAESYDRWRVEFERQWLESTEEFSADPDGDPTTTARRLYEKYGMAELSM
jgi:alpha-N-acetylglucosaminidase